MLARVDSALTVGLLPLSVTVEVDISKGLHSFSIVGLPGQAVEEARDRITAAIKNSGFPAPHRGNKKIIVSLAPADIKKEGASFDLAIALATLAASEEIRFNHEERLFLGELSLSGELRPIKGALLIAQHAKRNGYKELFLPFQNQKEASLVPGIIVRGVHTLQEVASFINEKTREDLPKQDIVATPETKIVSTNTIPPVDFGDVEGQAQAKRGLEVAAAGGHNVALWGPPGTGKTMLARAFAGILPPLSLSGTLEVTGIHSALGLISEEIITSPPFRSPHHSASHVSILGGGQMIRPGEITLAHRGVLFLDEFPEFDRRVIEGLREPLEEHFVTVSRARGSVKFPAHFILIAALNPCPCGNTGMPKKECVCSPLALARYERRLSGPIMDRIDLWLEAPYVDPSLLSAGGHAEKTESIRGRIISARRKQQERFKARKLPYRTNSEIRAQDLRSVVPLSKEALKTLEEAARNLGLSARTYHKLIKVARTLADLDEKENVEEIDIKEALQYRLKSKST
jgi:magnesium chelatase family protein